MVDKIRHVVCPYCGCLCDDIMIEVTDGKISGVENACTLGAHKFLDDAGNRLKGPIMRTGDEWVDISYEEAIEFAVKVLSEADRPLLYGWSGCATETQAIGAHLAELIGGVVDSTTSVCHGPSILAIQEVGHPGCTLGQVKNRADTIIYWGSNPIEAHPRHLSRYTNYADAYFLHNAFRERRVIVVDVRKTPTAEIATEFVQLEQGGDYHVLSALRAIIRGRGDIIPDMVAGVPKTQLIRVADMCKKAKFGALFFGVGITMTGGKYKNIRNAIEFVDELNRHTKWTISPMRGHSNVYGSNEVFTWITGYPFAVDYSRGIAFYNPGETTAVDILARKEADAALIMASDPGAHFPRICCEHLAKIPTILFDPYPSATTHLCTLQIPSAVNGIDAAGTAYRMDGIPIRTRKFIETGYPTDTELMEKIYDRIRQVKENA
ncbi:formylmethanofuran dehydrogenase, subunit B [Methanospirillum hungatei JF-1]|uniref:formylmethanofuran dehydrogenase subunit B n=1 Tax=Methanospirillum hungatei JF-1 (strain ATCC 27890 / DSM 864 / NBRC 100397 / JF-1) TaxID=323259 RepID=Q2FLM1_METHJ|nr:formylmethanofuran dehydrogenase subunit B [Methanospirillum hungatei]ABD41815.1 formylmethanofuran dehydrogenase, subunit B [Methanospirillum hungatei JF-1]